MIEFGVTQ
jgi:hypothetical protein